MKDQMKNRENREESSKDPTRDIRKDYDPYKRDPGAGRPDDDRVREADERDARQRENVKMGTTDRLDDSTAAPLVDRGHVGQTARGSYGFNSSTGQGTYMDRTREGSTDVSADPLDRPSDRSAEGDLGDPDPEEERTTK